MAQAEMGTEAKKRGNEGTESGLIAEGEGRFPWWVWLLILGWLVYAFVIGPFEVTHP